MNIARLSTRYFFVFFIVHLIDAQQSLAQLEIYPSNDWKTLNTPHFQIIFRSPDKELAIATALRMEYAYQKLSQTWIPPSKPIPVLIRSDSDMPNGYATVLPYPHIVLFPVSPSFQESIGEYADWLYELCLHELIHIFTFEQRHGLVQSLYPFFGNLMTPNVLLPRWWLEGVAVDGESRYSEGGRMRSLVQEAQIRAIFQSESNVFSLTYPSINEFNIPSWPYGNRPYFFGSLYWNYLSQHLGNRFSGEVHQRTGSRAPYTTNKPLFETAGVTDIAEGFYEMTGSLFKTIQSHLEKIRQVPTTPMEVHSSPSIMENQNPDLSPDGKRLVTLARFADLTRGLVLYERKDTSKPFNYAEYRVLFGQFENPNPNSTNPLPSDLPWSSTITRTSWLPDSRQFVFDLVAPVNRFELRSDLWLYELRKKNWRRLTFKARAREPSVSPDGQWVAYVRAEPLKERLEVLSLNASDPNSQTSKKSRTLLIAAPHSHLHWPTWIDNNNIIVTEKSRNRERLLLIGPQNQKIVKTPCDRNRFTNFANNKLFVTCDQNGTWNVFVTEEILAENPKWQPVTHVETALLTHEFDPFTRTLLASLVTDKGIQLASLQSKDMYFTKSNLPLPSVPSTLSSQYPRYPIEIAHNSVPLEEQEYSPFQYLLPQYWIPLIWVTDKSTSFLAATSGFDPTMRHIYNLGVSYDTYINRVNHLASYTYRNTLGSWSILSFDESSYLTHPNLLTQIRSLSAAWGPWIEHPFINTSLFVSQTQRNLVNLVSHQWEWGLIAQGRFLQRSARFSLPNRGYQWSTTWSQHYQIYPTSVLAHSLRVFAEKYFTQTYGWLAMNRLKVAGFYLDQTSLKANYQQTFSWQVGNMQGGTIMRGYPTGSFFSPKLALLSFEHWLPGWRIDKGSSGFISYLHQISLGLVSDFLMAEGLGFSVPLQTYTKVSFNQIYSSFGIESVLDFNIGYHFDLQMVLAYYYAPPSVLSPGEGSVLLGFRF
ncbi:MAG: hypothetical protein RMK80_02490 [Pseudobdellovibrionaceae bacterium]|nr:hypothetical protein [Pseudobdellovibrionaceae bacterium]